MQPCLQLVTPARLLLDLLSGRCQPALPLPLPWPLLQDMEHRKNLTALEMVWRGSNSLEDAMVFAGNFASGQCSPGAPVAATALFGCLGAVPSGQDYVAAACPPAMPCPPSQATTVRQRGLGLSGPALPSWMTPAWTSTMCRTGRVAAERGYTAAASHGPCYPAYSACLPALATSHPHPHRTHTHTLPPPTPSPSCPTAQRVDAFVEQCRQLANVTRGPDIMLTMGSDFQFQNAHLQYKNLDKLIHYINQDGRVNAFYSTPAECVGRE